MFKVNQKLRLIANRQGGYFNSRQAAETGYSRELQSYHSLSGNWQRIDRALYRLHGYPDTMESAFTRWVLWAEGKSRKGCVAISHESALHYYTLQREAPQAVHLTISAIRRNYAAEGCVVHWAGLEQADCRMLPGFAVTSPERTLMDLKPDLIYRCRWVETVQRALESRLIDDTQRRKLLDGLVLAEEPGATAQAADGGFIRQPASLNLQGGQTVRTLLTRLQAGNGRWGQAIPNRSFTLVEMLVVVAIISLLAMLLMPALSSAVNMARMQACANNLRQCGQVTQQYADENNNRIYSRYSSTLVSGSWAGWSSIFINRGYLKPGTALVNRPIGEAIYSCPNHYRVPQAYSYYENAYGINHLCVVKDKPGYGPENGFLQFTDAAGIYHEMIIRTKVTAPSSFLLLSDSFDYYIKNFVSGYVSQKSAIDDNIGNPGSKGAVWLRHSGYRANVCYLDGHVGAADLSMIPTNLVVADERDSQ